MMCEHFEETRGARCRAVAGRLVPSLFEREQYCTSGHAGRCPTLQLYRLRGTRLPSEAYWSLWIPCGPAGAPAPTVAPPPGLLVAGELNAPI